MPGALDLAGIRQCCGRRSARCVVLHAFTKAARCNREEVTNPWILMRWWTLHWTGQQRSACSCWSMAWAQPPGNIPDSLCTPKKSRYITSCHHKNSRDLFASRWEISRPSTRRWNHDIPRVETRPYTSVQSVDLGVRTHRWICPKHCSRLSELAESIQHIH